MYCSSTNTVRPAPIGFQLFAHNSCKHYAHVCCPSLLILHAAAAACCQCMDIWGIPAVASQYLFILQRFLHARHVPVPWCACTCVLCNRRRQQNVDETLAELRGKGLTVSGMVCHVGNAQQRQALVDRTIQARLSLQQHGGPYVVFCCSSFCCSMVGVRVCYTVKQAIANTSVRFRPVSRVSDCRAVLYGRVQAPLNAVVTQAYPQCMHATCLLSVAGVAAAAGVWAAGHFGIQRSSQPYSRGPSRHTTRCAFALCTVPSHSSCLRHA
jgi:hypothetical protein